MGGKDPQIGLPDYPDGEGISCQGSCLQTFVVSAMVHRLEKGGRGGDIFVMMLLPIDQLTTEHAPP